MKTGLTQENLEKSFIEFDLIKGGRKTGTYQNTAENRKKGVVGQKYTKDKDSEVDKKSSTKDKKKIVVYGKGGIGKEFKSRESELHDAAKARNKNREDVDAHNKFESTIASTLESKGIPKDIAADMAGGIMEDPELSYGENPKAFKKYLDEMVSDYKKDTAE